MSKANAVVRGRLGLSVVAGLVSFSLVMVGCKGSTDGGSAGTEDFSGTQFVSADGTTGTMTLELGDESLSVAETTSFEVFVKDENNAPVENIQIVCDTEAGLALVEPTNGRELTGQYGGMSGVVGCAAPGSFQIGCRLPVGINKRVVKRISCTGDVPDGFTGFPNAGGGGLGGTAGNGDVGLPSDGSGGPGGTDNGGVILQAIDFIDLGTTADGNETRQIDIIQNADCDGDSTTADPEPFTDSFIKIKIKNNTNESVTFKSYSYRVGSFSSSTIFFNGSATVTANGGTNSITALFTDAASGFKKFIGSSSVIGAQVSNVRVTINGTNQSGETIQLTGAVTVAFDGYNHCGS